MTQTPGASGRSAASNNAGARLAGPTGPTGPTDIDPVTNPGPRPEVVSPHPGPVAGNVHSGTADDRPGSPGPDDSDPRLRLSRGVLVSGRYLLTRRLEHASTRELWQAVDQTLVRDVRMIVVQASDDRADRILDAARRAALVRDQHFLRVFDADRATVSDLTRVWRPGEQESRRVHPAGAGRPLEEAPGLAAPLVYVVEEWVSAQSLQTLLHRSPLPARQAVLLTLELAEALAAAHAQGMPHGFVGPDRVLVAANGSVRVSGLRSAAVLTARPPAPPGSSAAAEQDAADAAADVRSVGAVLYAALTARWPLGGDADAPTESLWRWTPGAATREDAETADRPTLRSAPRAHGRVLAPRQVRPGVPRRLDELVLRLLGQPVGDHAPVHTPAEAVELLSAHLQPTADRGGTLPALRDLADQQGRARQPLPGQASPAPAGGTNRTDGHDRVAAGLGGPGSRAAGSPAAGPAPGDPVPGSTGRGSTGRGSPAPVASRPGTVGPGTGDGVRQPGATPSRNGGGRGSDPPAWRETATARQESGRGEQRSAAGATALTAPTPTSRPASAPAPAALPSPAAVSPPTAPSARPAPPARTAEGPRGAPPTQVGEPGRDGLPAALALSDDRPAFLAWQGAEARIEDDGPGAAFGAPVGRVPGDRRSPDLRLNPVEPPVHRLRPLLVLIVVVALLGAGTALVLFEKKTLSGHGSNPPALKASASARGSAAVRGSNSPQTPAPVVRVVTLPIVGSHDFDPLGNGSENPDAVGLATDGNPSTAWTTVTYYGRADLGGEKPGVGLELDLGAVHEVRRVIVGLVGEGTALEILTSSAGDRPRSLDDFREHASTTDAGTRASLPLDSPVRARWVLIWLTRLPQVGAGSYQGGISSITVRGQTGS